MKWNHPSACKKRNKNVRETCFQLFKFGVRKQQAYLKVLTCSVYVLKLSKDNMFISPNDTSVGTSPETLSQGFSSGLMQNGLIID